MNPISLRLVPLHIMSLSLLASGLDAQRSSDQAKDQEKLVASFVAMQTHSWYTGGGWTTDFGTAKARARETGKPILAYFTRTYAP